MEPEKEPRKLRIVSGTCADVENQIADSFNTYAVTQWNFWNYEGKGYCTAVLLHESVLRQMQIANPALANGARR